MILESRESFERVAREIVTFIFLARPVSAGRDFRLFEAGVVAAGAVAVPFGLANRDDDSAGLLRARFTPSRAARPCGCSQTQSHRRCRPVEPAFQALGTWKCRCGSFAALFIHRHLQNAAFNGHARRPRTGRLPVQ